MSAGRRTRRDQRRRSLGQNFIKEAAARRFVDGLNFASGRTVVEIGAGRGAITAFLAQRKVPLVALEIDPVWAKELRRKFKGHANVRIVSKDFFEFDFPKTPFYVIGNLPFTNTTSILRRLLDRPDSSLVRADLIVQWEVANKRAVSPPTTLLSTCWAPWWEVQLGDRIPANAFRPMPKVDAGIVSFRKRIEPLLPMSMATSYAEFVRNKWPF